MSDAPSPSPSPPLSAWTSSKVGLSADQVRAIVREELQALAAQAALALGAPPAPPTPPPGFVHVLAPAHPAPAQGVFPTHATDTRLAPVPSHLLPVRRPGPPAAVAKVPATPAPAAAPAAPAKP